MTDNNKNKKPAVNGKYKYGASAILFIIVFIAFVVVVNIAFSVVEDRTGGLTLDVIDDEMFKVSKQSKQVLSEIDKEIELIFCQPEDRITENQTLGFVKKLAEDYAANYGNINVVYKDLVSNPSYFSAFKKTSYEQQITYDSLIVNCKTSGLYKVLPTGEMISTRLNSANQEVLDGFAAETRITSAILSVARNKETTYRAGIVTGHAEDENHNVKYFLEDCGYEVVSPIDLKTISAQELEKIDLLIINNPQSDFFGAEAPAMNEIVKLTKYIQEDFGNVMVFLDPYTNANTPNLNEFFETFGVTVVRTPVTDKTPGNNSGAAGDTGFFGTYAPFSPKDDDGIDYGYEVHEIVSTSGSGLRPMFDASCLVKIHPGLVNNLRVYPVVVTSEEGTEYVDESMTGKPGSTSVISLSTYTRLLDDGTHNAKLFICGSTGFIDALGNNAVANTELFRSMLAYTGNENIVVNIREKKFSDTTLIVDENTYNSIMIYLAIAIPVIVALAGLTVYLVRKYWNGQKQSK